MDPCQVKIFTRDNVPRLKYIAGILLGDILGLPWEIVTDRRKLGKHPVINYSSDNITGTFKINPDSLLFEKGTMEREITVSEWKNLPVFFKTTPDSDIPFDIFAASFFLVSRYEEYLEFQPDDHGRFPAASSLAFKQGFLDKPVVDLWTKEFAKTLIKKFPKLAFRRNEFKSLLTIDSDQPFAYLGKNLLRSVGGMIHDLTAKSGHAGERYRVVRKGEKDPFEVYDYILDNIEKNKTEARFFFPTGDYSKYNKNPSWKNKDYRILIKKISGRYMIGLHPSYYSSDNYTLLTSELNRLKTISDKDVGSARYHFIRIFMPASYRQLSKAGIVEDFSMGYPDEPGFRAGIARPYYFYDVTDDRQVNLKIVPFQIMDGTLYQYKELDPSASKEIVIKLIDETRKVGGLFVSLWHNTSLQESEEWKGWRELFETMLKMQKS